MNMQLTRENLKKIKGEAGIDVPDDKLFDLPEKVLQFGTGILLRGLPDYFIDKANKQGIFNGRIVVVKSTSKGGVNEFSAQDGLFTHFVKGIEDGQKIEEVHINASISRVLSAGEEWKDILQCANNKAMQLIISNTTEIGIVPSDDDINKETAPPSFPGKLLAFLYQRYRAFGGTVESGMVIIPTELIINNGDKLKSILLDLAAKNKLEDKFVNWLNSANYFCNSLVDRIVPGRLPEADLKAAEQKLGYKDDLSIMSEIFCLWAIESGDRKVKEVLSFSAVDNGIVITPNIEKFRELKLRLLNGTHTFTCGMGHLAGFETVKETMNNGQMLQFIKDLTLEIATAMDSEMISYDEACSFAAKVLDRFRNPFLDHKWLSISMNFSSKMRMRNVPLLQQYYSKKGKIPSLMALGFAAYLVFMKCSPGSDSRHQGQANGRTYYVEDESAARFAQAWAKTEPFKLADDILGDKNLWGTDLRELKGFADAVVENIKLIQKEGVLAMINNRQLQQTTV
jgi:tagaturonate reductase